MAQSRDFAAELNIGFPLLSDRELKAARAYVGVDDHNLAVPGVVVLRADGSVAFRQIGEGKDDRLDAAAILAVVDREFGKPADAPALHGGYGTLERVQIGLGVGGGVADDRAVVRATALGLYPLHRYLLAGAMIDGEARSGWLTFDGALGARLPITGDEGALGLTLRAGRTVGELAGWHLAGRGSMSFAPGPNWAFELAVEAGVHRVGEDPTLELSATLGVTRLIRIR